jgi:hypothetical protein
MKQHLLQFIVFLHEANPRVAVFQRCIYDVDRDKRAQEQMCVATEL